MSGDWGIRCEGLGRRFGAAEALRRVDLGVRRGSLVALVGSNGAGKTTLMRILATLLLPSEGRAEILGLDVASASMACRRAIGYAPAEERSFHGRLTVAQNLAFFADLRGVDPAVQRRRAPALLEAMGLDPAGRARFSDLSSGMKQSLSLVRALLHEPPVLLLDEPTRSLSPDLARRVGDLLRHEARSRGRTILLATHNLGEADAVADEVAVLHRGVLRVQGEPRALCAELGLPGAPGAEAVFMHATGEAPVAEAP